MLNNLEQIKPRLKQVFDLGNKDLFFHLEIMQRKKEVDRINKNSNIVKSFAVGNLEYLEYKLEKEIIPICDVLNARAMINLNPKSFKKVTHAMLSRTCGYIESSLYTGAVTKLFDSCCSTTSVDKELGIEKLWILDVDSKESLHFIETLKSIIKTAAQYTQKGTKHV